ncbi:MAG: hypothetical protein WC289_04160 [Patescibacteria group bacterium]|jgi:hypothetical protein
MRQELSIWFAIAAFVALWLIAIVITGRSLSVPWEAIKLLPDVISIYVLLYLAFNKWMWRWRMFGGWLVTVPDLQGTWKGQLKTTWTESNIVASLPIEIYVTIRQTLHEIHVSSFTKESVSHSDASALCIDLDKGQRILTYTYGNIPQSGVRDRSEIHFGAARLRIVLSPNKRLEGEYWTDRKSTGHLILEFDNRNLLEQFPN